MNYPSPLVALRKSRRALTHRSDDLFVTVHAIRSPVWKAAASTRKWNTETVDDLAALTEGLTGSPYSLPDDPLQRDVVLDALRRAVQLEKRCQAVRVELAKEPEQRLRRATRTSEIFESNAI